MLDTIRIALIAVLIAGSASAALARPSRSPAPGATTGSREVVTDEGQGRYLPADGGAP
jgi:hypothetical protein